MTDKAAAQPQVKQTAPPYVSYKTFRNFLSGLKVTMPSRIDRSVLHNFSGAVKAQINHAIHALSLVNSSGVPEPDLALLVNSEGPEKEKVLRRILQKGYPSLFEGMQLETATAQQLIEKFSKAGATGDTARKAIAFFLEAAKEAGIKTSPYFKKAGSQARGSRKPPANGGASAKPPVTERVKPATSEKPANAGGGGGGGTVESMDWAQLLLSKFPSFDPAWPDDVKSKWFDAFDKLMGSQTK